jgi:hypothetical protein
MLEEMVVAKIRYYPNISVEGLSKTTVNISNDIVGFGAVQFGRMLLKFRRKLLPSF